MLDVRLKLLLQELSTTKHHTAMELSEHLDVSEKTARMRIKELNEVLIKHGAMIASKQRFGYKLEILDESLYQKFMQSIKEKNAEHFPTTSAERVPFILAYLLNREDYIKLEDLSGFLFVSRNTLTADLKKVECILNMYHLKLERRPNYGIIVMGREFHRRICMANSIIKRSSLEIEDTKKQREVQIIGDIFLRIVNNYKIKITEISFESLVIHTYIAIGRISRNCQINWKNEDVSDILREETIELAKEIAKQIHEQLGVVYETGEILYLAIHLSAKIASDSNGKYGSNLVISGKIDELVLRMINSVYEVYKFDFRNNLELRMSLNQHMVPFDIRMQYGIPLKNPILQQIKKEYALAYTIASGACIALSEHYKMNIPEDEIGYFATIFALALEKQDKKIEKKNIVVVCVSGKGSSQLFMYKYKQAFGKYINNIYECTVFELEEFDFVGNQIDYVFATIPINIKVPVPVFEVNLFMENKDIIAFSEMFELGSNKFLHKYYKKELFLSHIPGKTKEEVLQQLCYHAGQHYHLPENFYDAIMKREELGQTDFGNLAAIPHPYKVITTDNFVTVGVLDEPIWWGHNEVQVVFLVALSTEMDADIERFYQLTTNLLFDSEKIELLIHNPSFATLLSLLSNE
jgi:lichenan operon transcriptional antiterminator